jgi:hypothetical protein
MCCVVARESRPPQGVAPCPRADSFYVCVAMRACVRPRRPSAPSAWVFLDETRHYYRRAAALSLARAPFVKTREFERKKDTMKKNNTSNNASASIISINIYCIHSNKKIYTLKTYIMRINYENIYYTCRFLVVWKIKTRHDTHIFKNTLCSFIPQRCLHLHNSSCMPGKLSKNLLHERQNAKLA